MNKNSVSKFTLQYYSLTTQIIIINLITAAIGLFFVCFFNLFLFNNNKNIEIMTNQVNDQIDEISNYLEKNAIIRIPLFNEESGEMILSSEPQLDPYASQLYLKNKHLNQLNEIKIYNSNLIKYVDTKYLYSTEEVLEVEIGEINKKQDSLQKYKQQYFNLFNYFQQYFDRQKLEKISEPAKNDINLIIEAIKQQKKISKYYFHEKDILSYNIVKPLIQSKNIYGVVLIRVFLTLKNNQTALISFNLFNLFLIIIFFMFLLSIFFTKSIIRPIKILSSLVKVEQNKFYISSNPLKYPIRNDEIGGLSSDIKNMSIELKSQINELEEFAADVAHELKNPLTSAKASNDLLAKNQINSKDRKLLFKNISKDLDRMNMLISDISEYTRTQAKIEKIKFQEFNLIKFIDDLKISFSHNKKKIHVIFKPSDLNIIIQANADKLARVFINIIENAISFSSPESNILIFQTKVKENVIIYIADQGTGIKKELKNKIFTRFYTDRSDKHDYSSGLGLSISKKIMESFKGSLELSEKKFKDYNGACFKLELPIKG